MTAAKSALADFDTYLEELGYTLADLSSYKAPYTALQNAVEEYEKVLQAERLSQTVYAPVEMEFLNDYFATKAERGGQNDTLWFDGTKPYNAYLGWYTQSTALPMSRTKATNGGVISVDYSTEGLNKKAELNDGRYVLPVGGVPYRLGEINEGVLDANAYDIGVQVAISEDNMLNNRLDEKYALSKGTSTYTVQSGKFPVTVANAKKVNVLTTSLHALYEDSPKLYTVNALVHLDNGDTVGYILLTAPSKASGIYEVNNAVVFVPKNSETDYSTYSAITNGIGGEVKTLAEMTEYKIADIKLPSAPEVNGTTVDKGCYKGLTGEKVGTTRTFTYDNVILPESTEILSADWSWERKATISSFEITAPEGRTITAVEFIHDAGPTLYNDYVPAVGGYAAMKTSENGYTGSNYYIPATIDGCDDYQPYVRITRNCHFSAVLGMTAETTGTALVTINNVTQLANKPYTVILAYYGDNEGELLGTKVVHGFSTTDKTTAFTVNGDNMPSGTKVVKGFIWKDFTTLIPLTVVNK